MKQYMARGFKMFCGLILVLNLTSAHAGQDEPSLENPDILGLPREVQGPDQLPGYLEKIVQRKVEEAKQAPAFVQRGPVVEILSFFENAEGQPLEKPRTKELLDYATKLHRYYEEADSKKTDSPRLFRGFIDKQLKPFVQKLTWRNVRSHFGAQTSIEDLVVTQELSYLARSKGFLKKTMGLLNGKNLRGVSAAGLKLVIFGSALYLSHEYFNFGSFLLGMTIGGLNNAVGGPIVGVLTGWFTNPTSQFLKLKTIPLSAPLERWMNSFYDNTVSGPTRGGSFPRPSDLLKDGTNFAGMTVEDQNENVRRVTSWWATLAISFGRVFRDTAHGGRGLLSGHSNDELFPTTLVETLESKMIALRNLEENLLNRYTIHVVGKRDRLQELETVFDNYRKKSDEIMTSLVMDEVREKELLAEWDGLIKQLLAHGFSERDIRHLNSIQADKALALEVLAAVLAHNEARHFNLAEYRTLQGPGYNYLKALQEGLQLQRRIEQYQKLVATQQVKMGYQNSSAPKGRVVTPGRCAQIFATRAL